MMLAGALAVGAVAVAGGAAGTGAGEHGMAALRDTPIGRLFGYNLGRMMMLRSEANVTSEQREKVRETILSHRDEIRAVVSDLVAKRRSLRDEVLRDQPDEAAIRKASADLGASIAEAAVLGARVRGELRPVFTDEQLKLFQAFRTDHDASVDRWLGDMIANPKP
jgi:Spy/CpxP family protein refolding chaperone